jgi:hypothetical protein
MKEYKLIYLNKGFSSSREKDLVKAEEKINEMTDQENEKWSEDSHQL